MAYLLHHWTPLEALEYDSLLYGCEQEQAYQDDIHREAVMVCEVCEDAYHCLDLEPCGPAEMACPNCRQAWDDMDNESESASLVNERM